MAPNDRPVQCNRRESIMRWLDEHRTTLVTVAVCAAAVGIVAFGASQLFSAHEVDDAKLERALCVREEIEQLEALYAEADADFVRVIVSPGTHTSPWSAERAAEAEDVFATLDQLFEQVPERVRGVAELRDATHDWQLQSARAVHDARLAGNAVALRRDVLLAVDQARHRVATGLRSLDAIGDLSAGAHASTLARRNASERIAFAAATTAAFVLLVYGFLTNQRIALERARAKIATEEGEARFREYFEEHPLPILIYDVDTLTVAAANDAAVHQYGYTREEFAGLPITALRPRDDADTFISRFIEMSRTPGGQSGARQVRTHVRKDGSHFHVEPSYHFLRYANRQACFVVAVDVTEKENAKEALQQSNQMLEAVIDSVPERIFWKDTQSRYLGCNRAFAEDVGLGDAAQVIGLTDYDLPWRDIAAEARLRDAEVIASGEAIVNFEAFTPNAKGEWRWQRKTKVPLRNARGDVIGLLATSEDVTERKRVELELLLRSRALDSIVNAVLITRATDYGNVIEYANPAFERITGYQLDDVRGTDCRFLQREDRDQVGIESIRQALAEEREVTTLLRNYRRDGALFWNQIYIAPVRDETNRITHHISVVNDVTELVQSRDLLEQQANVDALTGLPNRNKLNEQLKQAIIDAREAASRVALVFMDVDHFKDVNDSLGHGIGDRLLRAIGSRLASCVDQQDVVARYGGDEFVIVVPESGDADRLAEVLARVSQAFARPVWIDETEFFVDTSVGIACFPDDGPDAETLLRRADLAMYRAKSNGRNALQRFSPELGRHADERLSLSRRMRIALANGEFRLEYQPQIDLQANRVTGVEALLRWRDEELGPVSPATFIPIAEENGLIVPIGEWVMQQACFQAQAWQASLPGLRMSVNLSPRQFARGDILRVIQRALTRAQISPRLIEVEITEGALMHPGSIEILRALRAMDIDIAIDDFGTGYSSLSYIRNFHAERLKLDMSFVRGIGIHREDEVITRAILSLGRALGFQVVAEGVETDTQLAFLRRHGCNVVQGYRYARPMPAADAHTFIENFNQGEAVYG